MIGGDDILSELRVLSNAVTVLQVDFHHYERSLEKLTRVVEGLSGEDRRIAMMEESIKEAKLMDSNDSTGRWKLATAALSGLLALVSSIAVAVMR